jgi:hypothetical protein
MVKDHYMMNEFVTYSTLKETLLKYIQNEYPDISKAIKFLDDWTNYRNGQIIGELMSGKSEATAALQHYILVFHGHVCWYQVPLLDDISQYKKSLRSYNEKWVNFGYSQLGVIVPELEYLDAEVIKISKDKKSLSSHESFVKNMTLRKREIPKLVLMINHPDQMYRMSKLNQELISSGVKVRSFRRVCDESHITLFPTVPKKETIYDINNVHSWPARITLYQLSKAIDEFPNCVSNIGSSATATRNFFDDAYQLNFIISLTIKPPACNTRYVGTNQLQYDHIEEKQGGLWGDPDLDRVVDEMASKPMFDAVKYNLSEDHPVVFLIQVSRYKKDHISIGQGIVNRHPDTFTIITYNDSGMHVQFTNEQAAKLCGVNRVVKVTDDKTVYKSTMKMDNTVLFKPRTPLHAILDLPVKLQSERIIIIAGDKMKQGRRANDSKYKISITNEFLRSESVMDTALQKQRCAGYKPGSLPITIHTTEQLHKDLICSYNLNHEIRQKLEFELNGTSPEGGTSCKTILGSIDVSYIKIPTKEMCKSKIPMRVVNKNEDDFFRTGKEYLLDIEKSAYREIDKVDVNEYFIDFTYPIVTNHKKIYKDIEKYLKDDYETGVYHSSCNLMKDIYGSSKLVVKNRQRSLAEFLESAACVCVDDTDTAGLLFKKVGISWAIKYNSKI